MPPIARGDGGVRPLRRHDAETAAFRPRRLPRCQKQVKFREEANASNWKFASWPDRPVDQSCRRQPGGCGVEQLDGAASTCTGKRSRFVTARDLIAPSIAAVLLPIERRTEFFRRTALVNRPVMMRGPDRHFAVGPGIPPGNIAAVRGRPLPTYQVRPRVLAGAAALPGAIQVRAADLRREREGSNRPAARERGAMRDNIRSSSVIRPSRGAPQPQPLGRGEVGRLGATPPRAAHSAAVEQGTLQRTPGTQSSQQRRREQRQIAAPQAGRGTEQRRGNITPPHAPPPTAQVPARSRQGGIEKRRARERTPVARAPAGNQGTVQRGPAARPPVNRPPAVATPARVNRPPAVAARPQVNRRPAAAPPVARPPAFAARPPSRPPAAAPRPTAPPVAAARPAPPMAAARQATVGAAPRGGPSQKRPP
jgi:hypothetical protein